MGARQVTGSSRTAEESDHPGAMSPWNRDVLVSLRGDLKLKVSMSTGLCDILEEVAGGFMSSREAQVVREQQGSSEQMDRLIDILCGKGDKDFSTFLQMLRGSNNEVWAEELERKAEDFKRKRGVCAERKETTQRYSTQCLQCNRGPCTWHSTASLQRCTALLHMKRLIL